MTARPGECLTCGFPGLRSAGHAEWCAGWEAMSQEAKNTAAIQYAAATGVFDLGKSHREAMRRARQRTRLP